MTKYLFSGKESYAKSVCMSANNNKQNDARTMMYKSPDTAPGYDARGQKNEYSFVIYILLCTRFTGFR